MIDEPLIDAPGTLVSTLRWVVFGLAVLALVVSVVGRRLGWLEYQPGGAAFDNYISPAFIGMFAVATLLALRWPVAGGILAAFAAAGLVAFAQEQLIVPHAFAVVALFAVPGILWLIIEFADYSVRSAAIGTALTVLTAIGGYAVGHRVYDHFWGPTHPESSVARLPDSPVEWVWSGGVTTTEGEVRAKPRAEFGSSRLAVSTDADLADPTWIEPSDDFGPVVGFRVTGLDADTTYHYAVEIDGELDRVRTGAFTTFPEGAASFRVAVGACARVGSNGAVFDAIRELDPLFYLNIGDLHYGDNGVNDVDRYRDVMDLTLAEPAQSALYRSTPIAYVWDDHDYGANDADGNSPSREAAMQGYREYVPSYELAGPESAVYQAFTVGRVRFVLTDARSARNLDVNEEPGPRSMLGAEQKAWFKDEIVEASRTSELVVWVNTVPWVAEEREGADHWAGYADERRELADHIADNDIDNLLMVAGDAHMVAIDDGSHTDYSTDGHPGFPLLHSAALDRPGSVKGGPYSEGAIGSGGQFATIDVVDDGDAITVELTARTWDGQELMSYTFDTTNGTGVTS